MAVVASADSGSALQSCSNEATSESNDSLFSKGTAETLGRIQGSEVSVSKLLEFAVKDKISECTSWTILGSEFSD